MMTRSLALACLAAVLATPVWAVPVTVAGRVAPSDPPAFIADGQPMLPATLLTERLGLALARGKTAGMWEFSSYERVLKVRVGSAAAVVDGQAYQGARAVELRDGHVFVPADMIEQAFGIAASARPGGQAVDLAPPGAAVLEVRAGTHAGYLRLVMEVTGPGVFWGSSAAGELSLEIAPPSPLPPNWKELRLLTFDDPLEPSVKITTTEKNWTRVALTTCGGKDPQVFTLNNPLRIVVDVPREEPLPGERDALEPEPATTPKPNLPDVPQVAATPWQVRTFATARGSARIFVLKATPGAVRPALAASTIFQRARTSKVASRANAQAAVNGGYFDETGPPLGLLIVNGEWIKHPMMNRAALCITSDGQATIQRLGFRGEVEIGGAGTFALDGLNTGNHEQDSTVLYTRRWGGVVAGSQAKARVMVSAAGQVLQVALGGQSVEIPPGGYVISASGQCAVRLALTQPGVMATARLRTVPEVPHLLHALGAGPQLLSNGKVQITAGEEQFRADVRYRACPRTAVGIHEDGNVVVVAGESADGQALTLSELAGVMLKLGCRDAMSLDGGGSTTVVAGDKVLNSPTDGSERAVATALLVMGSAGGK